MKLVTNSPAPVFQGSIENKIEIAFTVPHFDLFAIRKNRCAENAIDYVNGHDDNRRTYTFCSQTHVTFTCIRK